MIHPYQNFLEFNDIEHVRTQIIRTRTNSFVERFNRTALDEFFSVTFRSKLYPSIVEVQEDLNSWLNYYDHERPHRGYGNMGKRPIDTIEEGKLIKEQTMKLAA